MTTRNGDLSGSDRERDSGEEVRKTIRRVSASRSYEVLINLIWEQCDLKKVECCLKARQCYLDMIGIIIFRFTTLMVGTEDESYNEAFVILFSEKTKKKKISNKGRFL